MRPSHAILLAAILLAPGAAWAQGNPSSDLIIRQLRPGTRGIRPVAPSDNPAPTAVAPNDTAPRTGFPARRAPPTSVPANAPAPSVNLSVQFATNSAELTPAATRTLDELGRALSSQSLAAYRFRIEGHTDTVGNRERNKQLSEERAAKVVDYLASKFSVDRARVEAVGLGEDQLLVPTPPNTPQARNRRVTVINLGS